VSPTEVLDGGNLGEYDDDGYDDQDQASPADPESGPTRPGR
jgi:hypothetical protein